MLSLVDAAGREVPFPTNLLAATPYLFRVRSNGFAPVQSEWSLRQGSSVLVSGTGTIRFTAPLAALAIYVRSMLSTGSWTEAVFTFSAVSRRAVAVEAGVLWSRTTYAALDTLRATISVSDPEGLPARSTTWRLLRNSACVATGTTAEMSYSAASYGVYRLQAVVVDGAGATHVAEGATYVQGGFEVQATVAPSAPPGTMYHLGDVFLNEMQVDGGVSTELPVVTASLSLTTFLLPGTTHVKFDLVGQADDEVVVRTALGNWALVGPPTGFVAERVGYDYALPPLYSPVGPDLCFRVTVDLWNVRGYEHGPSAFTVRVRCFRSGPLLNSYDPCQCSSYVGGDGARTRKLALVFSEANLELDVESGSNRLGSSVVELFSTGLVTSFPAVLASSGLPYPMDASSGFSLSPANLVATYEPARSDLTELDAKGVAGIPNVRPFILTFSQAANPQVVQRLKRVGGRVACYISEGAVEAGAVVSVGIETSARGRVNFIIPVTTSVYADAGTFAKVGEVALELTDYDFTPGGLVAHFSILDTQVARQDTFATTGAFTVVKRQLVLPQTGRFRVIQGRPATDQSGQFRVVRGTSVKLTTGQFAVLGRQPINTVTGLFQVVARQGGSAQAGQFRVVRGTQRNTVTQPGQFAVLKAFYVLGVEGQFRVIPDPNVYRNMTSDPVALTVSSSGVALGVDINWIRETPVMTSASTPSGLATASSEQAGNPAWMAFATNQRWFSETTFVADGSTGIESLTYQFSTPRRIRMLAGSFGGNHASYDIHGSNDGSSWQYLARLPAGQGSVFPNNTAWRYIRLTGVDTTPFNGGYQAHAINIVLYSS